MNSTAPVRKSTASARRNSFVTNVVGGLIVAAALAVGAGFGHLTSPGSPAHASVPQESPRVCLVCGSGSGGVGHVPNPLTDGGAGGVGNLGTGGRR